MEPGACGPSDCKMLLMCVRMATGYTRRVSPERSLPRYGEFIPSPSPLTVSGIDSCPSPYPSGNRYPTGTAYPINKDTWGRSFAIGDVSSSPGYKYRSLGDAEEKERGCEEDEQRWQRDRTEEARGTSARETGVLVLLAEMVGKN